MRILRRLSAGEAGFTLVELLIVVMLLGIVGGIVGSGLTSAFRATTHAEARVQALTAMQAALANVSRDVRAADSREVTDAALRTISPSALGLDLFRDGRRVRLDYTVTAGELRERRRVYADEQLVTASGPPASDATRVLLRGLTDTASQPVFAYGDAFGAPTTTLDDVREVTIRLRRALGTGRQPLEVLTRVTLRNP